MCYRSLQDCLLDLERNRMLIRVAEEVDADLEVAAIVRRVCERGGPALLFTNPRNSRFPLLGNLFGTMQRARFIFRESLSAVRNVMQLRNPAAVLRHPWSYLNVPRALFNAWPATMSAAHCPVLRHRVSLADLPRVRTWPLDGGSFITLPAVYTENPHRRGWVSSNLGMYRIQLSGGQYQEGREVGMHYQIHRGIGVHHAAAIERGEKLRVTVAVGGPPALIVAAVMPLPEGMPEVCLAGMLAGHRMRLSYPRPLVPVLADADFCLVGTVDPVRRLPEGPFGDHLGYYSMVHDFPVLEVEAVYHRPGAIWPFTSVGRPPQEDSVFGQLIHELTAPVIPAVLPGVKAVHAVDAAGVHPLLLAIGSERYVPYQQRVAPLELLTQANAILGQGQMSLAKYLLIVAAEDDPALDVHNVSAFFQHLLERIDWRRDLHFQTQTSMDTLDYSGGELNRGSKVVMAAVGPPRRVLPRDLTTVGHLPDGFREPRVCMPGVLAISAPPYSDHQSCIEELGRIAGDIAEWPLLVVVDDSAWTSQHLNNFLWVTFTRSNPAADIHGAGAFVFQKHWGCEGPLIIDARAKPHHAPPLQDDAAVIKRIESMSATRGHSLHGLI